MTIQVPPDSTGKKLSTETKDAAPSGAPETVHVQEVRLAVADRRLLERNNLLLRRLLAATMLGQMQATGETVTVADLDKFAAQLGSD